MQRCWAAVIECISRYVLERHCLIKVVCFVCLVGVVGCASLERQTVRVLTPAERQELYDVEAWSVDGRIAVHSEGDAWHAGFSWRHDSVEDVLHIAGPLGQGAVDIVLRGQWIQITRSDGTREVSERPEELLQARLGVAVPLSALRYWILGLPEPDFEHVSRHDSSGQLRALKQLGWDVIYERYSGEGGWVLPTKMLVMQADIRLKIVIDQWHLERRVKRL
jgi:outer membrane lipoprotein LolB